MVRRYVNVRATSFPILDLRPFFIMPRAHAGNNAARPVPGRAGRALIGAPGWYALLSRCAPEWARGVEPRDNDVIHIGTYSGRGEEGRGAGPAGPLHYAPIRRPSRHY